MSDPAALQKAYLDQDKRSCVATSNQWQESYSKHNTWHVKTFEEFTSQSHYLGMPFGLTHLNDAQQKSLLGWVEAGAKGPGDTEDRVLKRPTNPAPIIAWEEFLNQQSSKAQQTARYIFEHVFSTIIYFEEDPDEYFDLVRSSTREGDIVPIVTVLPTDGPGGPFYYRFRKVTRAIVQKTANVWRLNATKLKHLDEMFLQANWGPGPIPNPDYSSPNKNNIFAYFSRIPADIRSRFMRENSRVIVGAMVQGMVCIGSTATYAISDHFWAWLLKPESDPSVQTPDLGLPSLSILNTNPEPWVPQNEVERKILATAEKFFFKAIEKVDFANQVVLTHLIRDYRKLVHALGYDSAPDQGDEMLAETFAELHKNGARAEELLKALHHFLRTTHANRQYQKAFELQLRLLLQKQGRKALSLDDLWKGDGDPNYPGNDNPNAWLNITRHERSASVQFGPEGGFPQSIWVMSYSNFERLYYNLVAEYMAWGSTTHKMATWRHMSYVRLEGEDLAISLLPVNQREEVREWFTRGLGGIKNKLFFPLWSTVAMQSPKIPTWKKLLRMSDLPARPDAQPELRGRTATETVHNYVAKLLSDYPAVAAKGLIHDEMVSPEQRAWEARLTALQNRSAAAQGETFAQFLPNITYLRVEGPEKKYWVYTILADRGYKSHNLMLLENPNRDPQYDTLAVYRGFVGAYPEVFLDIPESKRDGLAGEIEKLRSPQDWSAFASPVWDQAQHG